ncbi:UPF0669 protein C6orf120-like [Hondaea fermentalgiana]|uniref:UPF0669 protein C6orf120-like n=1 Tax=Hondaea fermentalgiana TaxID=2315210 RepID=A0A2R5G2Z9_9STRA|nr:UPF0669 protein C6orf120-like [Hondaea fermentalgiana]|eukprot:GBG25382.1 UPF0669 protein C6orf120-like [Hondaea fermentalgiana]
MELADLTLAKVDIDRAADASILQLAHTERLKTKASAALANALELLNLASKLKTLNAEMNPKPPHDLESGYEITDNALQGETRIYRLPFEPDSVGFKVVLQATEGDPDLYVCQTHQKPSMSHHTWRSASEGNDVVHVQQGDPKFKESSLYIGIHGHSKCHFRLKANWIENRNVKRGKDALEFRQTAAGQARLDNYSVKRKLLRDLAELRKQTKESSNAVNARKLWDNDSCPSAEVQRAFWIGVGDFTVGKVRNCNYSDCTSQELPGVLRFGQRKLRERAAPRLSLRADRPAPTSRTLHQAHLDMMARMQRQKESLSDAFAKAAPVTELGGLTLEVPVRSADERTRKAFARGLVVSSSVQAGDTSSHALDMEKVGLARAQAVSDRQVVSSARTFRGFRR